MKKFNYLKIQKYLFIIMGMLIMVLLFQLSVTPNLKIEENREMEEYHEIQDVSYEEKEDLNAPIGIQREFTFQLNEEIAYDTTLIFRFSHQNAEVYLGNEKVYSLQVAKNLSFTKTPGTNWAMIPLYREDIGKEVRIVLTPVYENYQNQTIQILVGSRYAVYRAEFNDSLYGMLLSFINILIGVLLLCVALVFSIKRKGENELYSLALLSLSLGLWNFTQIDFSALLFPEKTIFLYYISVTMLMVCVIPLIQSIKKIKGNKSNKILEICVIVCSFINSIELLLQIVGVLDLREMLKLTHIMILFSSLILIIRGQIGWFSNKKNEDEDQNTFICLIGVGALLDMLIYYLRKDSFEMLFVMIAIFGYAIMEGFRLFFSYINQKQILKEKEIQLKNSRITILMSQIRSHFVFNILNAISGMCKYDPEKADETIVRFSRYLRNNIDIMEDDKPIPFHTELSHLEDYMALEQIRFGDKIEFYSDTEIEAFMIPPLILQPLLENAIKHGLTKKKSGGALILRTWEEGENIKISVEDNGLGFVLSDLKKEKSVGLKNIRYRLYHLMHGTIDIKTKVGVGTTVTLTIPKKEAEVCE